MVAAPPGSPYDIVMEARVAVLEQIAQDTRDILARMDVRMNRMEDAPGGGLQMAAHAGHRRHGVLFTAMAHGFHWI